MNFKLHNLIGVCSQMHPELSLRGAFCATKQSPIVIRGDCAPKKQASAKIVS